MKIIQPNPLVREAAEVLGPIRNDTVVIGAVALQVALADVRASITPTRDVDMVVPSEAAERVIRHLEAVALIPSDVSHEQGFTWVRDGLKVQLLRPFHPFPKGAARRLPSLPAASAAQDSRHRHLVAFSDEPELPRFWVVNCACLFALKEAAFGRTRPDRGLVVRDFHDAYLLVRHVPDELQASYQAADYHVRSRVAMGVRLLGEGADATMHAAREMVQLGDAETQRAAEETIARDARRFLRRL